MEGNVGKKERTEMQPGVLSITLVATGSLGSILQ